MNKKMSRYKGLILSCVSMMMIVVCVCSFSFESKAQTVVGSGSYSFGAGSPEYYTMEETDTKQFYYEPAVQNIYVNTSLNTSKYYRLFFDWNLSVNFTNHSGTSSHRTNTYLLYNGTKYYFDGRFCSIIVPGNGSNGFGLGLESYINVDQYWGYGTYTGTCSVTAYELSDEEVSQYLGVDDIENALKRQIVLQERSNELQEESNSWLGKIWNSIQQFFNPDEEDKEESDKLQSESNDKTDKLDDLNEQNKTDKTDIGDASNSVDENVDLESIDNYGNVLSVITENQYILQILLLVFSVALVAYVLFGKK